MPALGWHEGGPRGPSHVGEPGVVGGGEARRGRGDRARRGGVGSVPSLRQRDVLDDLRGRGALPHVVEAAT